MDGLHKFALLCVLTCLRQNALGYRIVNGELAKDNQWQFMASLQVGEKHQCGGALITKDFVLTAAHCPKPEQVVLGTHDLTKNNAVKMSISKTCVHPNYVNAGLGDDIMLLKLSGAVQPGKGIQFIDLPRPGTNLRGNETCEVAGWGKTQTYGRGSDVLLETKVSVISHQSCESLPELNGLTPDVICAGGYQTDKGFCQGDSGGPLVYNNMVVGVVSFNIHHNCKYPGTPNVYTDVTKFLPWINEIMNGGNRCK